QVSCPHSSKPRRLGPQPQNVMPVIFEKDPAAGFNGTNHLTDDVHRVEHMLQQEPSVCDIECTPLVVVEWQMSCVARPELHELVFPQLLAEPPRFGELFRTSLNADDATVRPGRFGEGSSQLAQTTSNVENLLS